MVFPRKSTVSLFELQAELATFLIEHYFHLRERMTNYGYSDLAYFLVFS